MNSRPRTAPRVGIGRILSAKKPGKPLTNFLDISFKPVSDHSNTNCALDSTKTSFFDLSPSIDKSFLENSRPNSSGLSVINQFRIHQRKYENNFKMKDDKRDTNLSYVSNTEKQEYKIAALRKEAESLKTQLYHDIEVAKNDILGNVTPIICYQNDTFRSPNT